jgi:hypothetical protein
MAISLPSVRGVSRSAMIELVGCRHVNMQALAICVTALYVVQACTLHTMNNIQHNEQYTVCIQCTYNTHHAGTRHHSTYHPPHRLWRCKGVVPGGIRPGRRIPPGTTPYNAGTTRGYGVGTAWVRRGYGVAACSARQTTCDRRSLRFNRHHTGKYLHGTECSIRTLFPLKTLCGAICSERSATFRSISSHSIVLAVTSFLPQATATSFCNKLLQQASDHIQPDSFSCRGVTAQEETNRRKATDNMQQATV